MYEFDANLKPIVKANTFFKDRLNIEFGIQDTTLNRIYIEKYPEINNSLDMLKEMDTLFYRYKSYLIDQPTRILKNKLLSISPNGNTISSLNLIV